MVVIMVEFTLIRIKTFENLNVLLVDGSSSLNNIINDKSRNISKKTIVSHDNSQNNKKVKLKKVKFSKSDLYAVNDLLSLTMSVLGIFSVGVNTETNKIDVGIIHNNKSKENIVKNFVKKNLTIKSKQVTDTLTFEDKIESEIPIDCVAINSSSEIFTIRDKLLAL